MFGKKNKNITSKVTQVNEDGKSNQEDSNVILSDVRLEKIKRDQEASNNTTQEVVNETPEQVLSIQEKSSLLKLKEQTGLRGKGLLKAWKEEKIKEKNMTPEEKAKLLADKANQTKGVVNK